VKFLFHGRPYEPGGTVLLHYEFPSGGTDLEPLPSLPPQPSIFIEPGEPAGASWPAAVATESLAKPTQSPATNLLSIKKFPLFTMQIAVVDGDRLLTVHPPISQSAAARADAINEIERATAACGAAHNCAVVLNRSGRSLNGVPIDLYSDEQLDLTDEVVRFLGR
jgi:hypothetical protein